MEMQIFMYLHQFSTQANNHTIKNQKNLMDWWTI